MTISTQGGDGAAREDGQIRPVETLRAFFKPRSIAVIGASHNQNAIGGRLLRNIVDGGFAGTFYPVNTKGDTVQSLSSYKSVIDCPGPVDLALVVTPAAVVSQVAAECGRKGVKGLIVISSGFSEAGALGARLQQELASTCKQYGMKLMGPNCMGLVNTDPDYKLNAQFSPFKPLPGRIGFLSQSGALGAAVVEHSNKLGLGMSAFVSIGNEADVAVIDLIQYWEADGNTDIILLYLESLGNPKMFLEIAKRVSRKKPILVVKSGRSTTGLIAARSHTGALLEGSDAVIDALFKQAGVIRTDTLEEMLDEAALLVSQPIPRGNKVGIITNAGGAGILAADACEEFGLEVPEYPVDAQTILKSFLHPEASVKNPVDMTAAATVADSARTIRTIADVPGVDSLLILFGPPIEIFPEGISSEILEIAKETKGRPPMLTTFMGTTGVSWLLTDGKIHVPSYPFPREAVQTLSRAVKYSEWLSRQAGATPTFGDAKPADASKMIRNAQEKGRSWLLPEETDFLLNSYGIPLVKTVRTATPDEAAKAASDLGGKVVLKGIAEGLVHRSEAGAVKVGLEGESEVSAAAREMASRLAAKSFAVTGFVVQPMIPAGPELIVGVKTDPTFGPVLACGSGGVLVELLKDLSIRIAPLTGRDATEMVSSLKVYPLLVGYRGGPKYDVKALEEVILRIAALASDQPEVAEIDLNPVIMKEVGQGATVVDARVRLRESK